MSQPTEVPKKFFWLDLETTGLEANHDRILEVAAIVTDSSLNELEVYQSPITHDKEEITKLLKKNPFWANRSDGLEQIVKEIGSGKAMSDVEVDLVALQAKHFGPTERIYLAGNSIRFDRGFIDRYFPRFAKRLHYRMLDVSSLKTWWLANGRSEYKKKLAHRALEDIRESIAELAFYSKDVKF